MSIIMLLTDVVSHWDVSDIPTAAGQHYQCSPAWLVLCPDGPQVPSDYEHLKLQDVGTRSVYSGLNLYVNARNNAGLTTGEY